MKNKDLISNSDLFDQYLINFQEDIKKIVGKFKKSFHVLSNEEVYSECNLHLLKNKEKIINSFPKNFEFTENEFKKIAYHYCKNETSWSHYRVQNKSYNRRRVDGFTETEDGTKTTFEAAIETCGEENEDIDNDQLFFESNAKRFFHVLNKYCYLLTEKECMILSYIQKGWSQEKIADKLEVTHQAVSFLYIQIQKKLNNFFNSEDVFSGGNHTLITKGNNCLDAFFNSPSNAITISNSDKLRMKDFIINNKNKFSGKEINKLLFNNKYTLPKISGAVRSLKLTTFVRSSNRRYTETEKQTVFRLYQKGLSSKEVAKKTGIRITCCQRLRAELVKNGSLPPLRKNQKKIFNNPSSSGL